MFYLKCSMLVRFIYYIQNKQTNKNPTKNVRQQAKNRCFGCTVRPLSQPIKWRDEKPVFLEHTKEWHTCQR